MPLKVKANVEFRCPTCQAEPTMDALKRAIQERAGTMKCDHCSRVNRVTMWGTVVGLVDA